MKIKIKDIIYVTALISIILLLIFRGNNKPIYNITPTKEIIKNIEGKESIINHYETKVIQDKKEVKKLQYKVGELSYQLDQLKQNRDTVQIIKIQDTIIYVQTVELEYMDSVVIGLDSIIVAQRFIINSKDTIIAIQNNEYKKVKRQRNISILFNGVLSAVAIFKKP